MSTSLIYMIGAAVAVILVVILVGAAYLSAGARKDEEHRR